MGMKRVCAWCNKFMGYVDHFDGQDGLITHTICDECADNLDYQLGVSLRRYLDGLNIPIILVDEADRPLLANIAAKDCAEAMALPGEMEWEGKIYECSHARLPDRCNHDIHCSGCTIRFAATETYATGQEIVSIPALVNGCTSSREGNYDLLISTSMVNGTVHLRIERI